MYAHCRMIATIKLLYLVPHLITVHVCVGVCAFVLYVCVVYVCIIETLTSFSVGFILCDQVSLT